MSFSSFSWWITSIYWSIITVKSSSMITWKANYISLKNLVFNIYTSSLYLYLNSFTFLLKKPHFFFLVKEVGRGFFCVSIESGCGQFISVDGVLLLVWIKTYPVRYKDLQDIILKLFIFVLQKDRSFGRNPKSALLLLGVSLVHIHLHCTPYLYVITV